jgi:hypothetical protein
MPAPDPSEGFASTEPEAVRRALAPLDPRSQKVVAGLFGVLIRDPERVRDREWLAQRLAEVTVLAGEFPADTPQEGVRAVQEWLQEHAATVLRATLLLFERVGADLAPRVAEGFTFEEAVALALSYLPSEPGSDG